MDNVFWNEFDRGQLSDEEMLAGFIRNDPSVEKEIRQIFENMHGILTRADYAIPWIRELKAAGYQVLVLSNFSDKVARDNPDALDFLEYVDGGILSYRDGVIKPDPAIYRLLISRYDLKPEECVFLDDTQEKSGRGGEIRHPHHPLQGDGGGEGKAAGAGRGLRAFLLFFSLFYLLIEPDVDPQQDREADGRHQAGWNSRSAPENPEAPRSGWPRTFRPEARCRRWLRSVSG